MSRPSTGVRKTGAASAAEGAALDALRPAETGPMQIPVKLIDEDPNQPRKSDNPGFSEESLTELADTIRLRGVKTPISVRHHPRIRGRYIINHGARRFRASVLAGKTTIPGYVDNDYTNADQVLENLQRNQLTPREIADYIGRELARGKLKRDIAKGLGKSAAFISQHVTLLSLPDPIAQAFNTGRVRDVTLINDLVTAYTSYPEDVTAWISDDAQEITRTALKMLREFIATREPEEFVLDETADELEDQDESEMEESGTASPDTLVRPIIQVRHKGQSARLLTRRRPSSQGFAWIRYEDGQIAQARLANVQLVALVEAPKRSTPKKADSQKKAEA